MKWREILKKLLHKVENVKKLEAPKQNVNMQEFNFAKSLKVNNLKKNNKIEVQVCVGNGLGIQKSVNY